MRARRAAWTVAWSSGAIRRTRGSGTGSHVLAAVLALSALALQMRRSGPQIPLSRFLRDLLVWRQLGSHAMTRPIPKIRPYIARHMPGKDQSCRSMSIPRTAG